MATVSAHSPEPRRARTSPSPPTDRVVGVLELLAGRPGRAFSLSEIARSLGINKATCHAVATSLVTADYLMRDPTDKTFTLGPALVAAGRAAEQEYPAVRLARAEVGALTEALRLPTSAALRSEEHLVIVAHADGGAETGALRIGRRIPLAPPFGGVFVAWAGPLAAEEWAARTGRPPLRERLLDSLAAIRQRGYSVERLTPAALQLRQALEELSDDLLAGDLQPMVMALLAELRQDEYLVEDLRPGARFPVSAMSAPVFDAQGRTQMNLSVLPHRDMTVREIERTGRRLRRSCARITHAVAGRFPKGYC